MRGPRVGRPGFIRAAKPLPLAGWTGLDEQSSSEWPPRTMTEVGYEATRAAIEAVWPDRIAPPDRGPGHSPWTFCGAAEELALMPW